LLIAAAVIGDSVNYYLGHRFGMRFFKSDTSRWFNKKHLVKTQQFYAKYGGKTIILSRFIPIIRTFAPFVAGMGQMNYKKFWAYNVIGGTAWVLIFLWAGVWFGELPVVKRNFQLVILAIIVISVLPAVIEVYLTRKRAAAEVRESVSVD
jgi:membrane-associated protein